MISRTLIPSNVLSACMLFGMLAMLTAVSSSHAAASHGNPFLVRSWTTTDDLPQSSVIALTRRHDGYLWMGTWDGLVRFDGANFTVFDESNTPDLPEDSIVYLFEDSQTNLWVGTETAGVLLIREGKVLKLGVGSGRSESRLVSATEAADGSVWLYTADGQLCRYLNGKMDVWEVGPGRYRQTRTVIAEADGLVWVGMATNQFGMRVGEADPTDHLPRVDDVPGYELDYLLTSRTGGYWRLANGRVQKWRGTRQIRDLGPYPWGESIIRAACEDEDGNLVVGTFDAGLYWFDEEGGPTRVEGLSDESILSLCMDVEGNLWVGTDGGGLNRVRRSAFQTLHGTENWVVQSVSADPSDELWIGCNGGELAHWAAGEMTLYTTSPDNPSVKAVDVASNHRVWVGTWGRGLFLLENETFQPLITPGLFQSAVVVIHEDHAGTLWLGMQSGLAKLTDRGPRIFRTDHGLTDNAIRALASDQADTLWIGTARGGLNRLRDGTFTAWRKTPDGFPSDDINALHVDEEGVVWITTGGRGLVRFRDGRWDTINKSDGLPGNSLGYLLEDEAGFLWIGSHSGLLRIAKESIDAYVAGRTNALAVRAFDETDGLPTRECTFRSQPAACQTSDGRLWFPTIKGLVTVHPTDLVPNPRPPPVAIESVRIDQREQIENPLTTTWPDAVTLAPGNGLLEVRYTSLNHGSRDRTQFRYRLEGHDPDWVEAGDDQTARYAKLAPGDYVFRVIAANEDGLWNRMGTVLAVTVLPPFWKTLWFTVISAAIFVAVLAGSVYYISTQKLQRQVALLRQKEVLERERARIARDLHDQLGANLTQVSLLGELVETDKDEPAEVEEHARQICQTARDTTHALDEIVWSANPSNDTLEGLINYVCKYAQDYLALAGLRYRLEAPSPIPPVTLQPEPRHNVFLAAKEAVNNVVKHANATEVRIALHVEPTQFTLEVADNGCGPEGTKTKAAKSRNGLRNMRKRMTEIGGQFTMDPAPGGGSVVRLTVPLKKTDGKELKEHPR